MHRDSVDCQRAAERRCVVRRAREVQTAIRTDDKASVRDANRVLQGRNSKSEQEVKVETHEGAGEIDVGGRVAAVRADLMRRTEQTGWRVGKASVLNSGARTD